MKNDDMQVVFAKILEDGSRIIHYRKKNGSMTIRLDIPKNRVKDFIQNHEMLLAKGQI